MNCVDGTRPHAPLAGTNTRCSCPEAELLAESERRLQMALRASGLSLWDWDIVNDRIPWSPSLQTLTGLSAERFVGSRAGMLKLAHIDDRALLSAALDRTLAGQGDFSAEYRIVRPDGAVRWIAEQGHVLRDAGGRPLRMIGTVADVTRRRRTESALRDARERLERRVDRRTRDLALANAALRTEVAERQAAEARVRELVARVVGAAEDERRRIGHELHDTFGQQLSLMLLQLNALRRELENDPAATARLGLVERLFDTVRHLDEALDRVESELRPPALDELGLEAALAHTAHAFTADSGVPVALHDEGLRNLQLTPLVETTVYRIVQEALANVRRHARARRVALRVERVDDELRVTIADDGRGFAQGDAAVDPRSRSFGLVGMRERAALVAGALDIHSEPGRGVTVALRIPLHPSPVR
ncbi:MAG: PAS domain-containing protein [Pseudomonadota bacterium]